MKITAAAAAAAKISFIIYIISLPIKKISFEVFFKSIYACPLVIERENNKNELTRARDLPNVYPI